MTPAEWLDGLEHISGSLPVTMFAMGRSWEGAVFTPHDEPHLYLVGEMPKRTNKLCFRFTDDPRDWFVATYFQADSSTLEPHQLEYHPFGKSWILHPWNNIEVTIDCHEPKPYKRIPASIT